jgi:hypothetical protein
MLRKTNYKSIIKIEDISELIVEKLVADFDFDEETATDNFFSSDTFLQLSETSNQFFQKDWTEIYKLLLNELKL